MMLHTSDSGSSSHYYALFAFFFSNPKFFSPSSSSKSRFSFQSLSFHHSNSFSSLLARCGSRSFMDCNQNLQDPQTQFQYRDEVASEAKCSSIPEEDPESSEICFDCNICLDSAQDPVVTLCGHLYCWSCIFEWLHVQSSSAEPFHEHQSCPVCKASISHASLVPLYGRGSSLADQEAKRSRLGLYIPPRPSPDVSNPIPTRSYQYSPNNAASFSSVENLGSQTMARMHDPAQMMLGELFYTRILWSFMGLFSDPFPSARIPRMRRQEMQAEKFLNRLSIFLFCCFILCWLSF